MKLHVPVWLALAVWLGGAAPGGPPGYRIFVSSESGDIVSQLTWDGVALKTVKVVPVGIFRSPNATTPAIEPVVGAVKLMVAPPLMVAVA